MTMEKIGQLAVFVICAQTLLHFRAKESYEKYIKLLVSMMLLILTMEPIMDLFGGKGKSGFFFSRIQVYEEELTGVLGRGALSSARIEEILAEITEQALEKQEQTEEKGGLQASDMVTENMEKREDNKEEIRIEEIEEMEVQVDHGKPTETP